MISSPYRFDIAGSVSNAETLDRPTPGALHGIAGSFLLCLGDNER